MSGIAIVSVPILPLHIVNAHILIGGQGCVLVDAGLPGSEKKFEHLLRKHGLAWGDVRLIVVTHAHVDHAGSAARLRELSGAPIAAHVGDLPHYLQKEPMTFCSTGGTAPLFLSSTGLIREPYVPFTPDILLDGDTPLALDPYGVPGHVQSTTGHTRGSLSVVLADGRALVGDLLASGLFIGGLIPNGRPRRPPFEDDPREVARQLERLLDAGSSEFYVGHGWPLTSEQVRRHVHHLLGISGALTHPLVS
ncbi:MAG: MBL fold metallo-hydrolase [Myxococcota bacterium]